MHIKLDARVMNQAELLRTLHGLSGEQAAKAYAKALNDTAFAVREGMQDEMRAVFDDPTDYILRSPRFKRARPDRLHVVIEPAYKGGKGVDPQKILNAQRWGGRRMDKRSEVLLLRAGILPNGYQTAIPSEPYPGSDDGKGNLRGRFIAHLISYLQASEEQGFSANMTDKRKASVHKGSKRSMGRRYFVSYGRMRGGSRMTVSKNEPDSRAQHLAAGIWAASGTGGVDVRPVLMFVRKGSYSVRFDMDKVERRVNVDAHLSRNIAYFLKKAAGR